MRAFLNAVYDISGMLAAGFLVAICAVVLLQVGLNVVDGTARLLGIQPLGVRIPSYSELAGYFLAASSFLALAYTLRSGDHIRVLLLVARLPERGRRGIEIWCLAAGGAISGFFAWYAVDLVAESMQFGDVSPTVLAVPLWIPQAVMALGLIILFVAFVDDLICVLRGGSASYALKEPNQ